MNLNISEDTSANKINHRNVALSSLQERICLLDKKGFEFYTQIVFKTEGRLDREDLLTSLKELVKSHDSLRSTYVENDQNHFPVQLIQEEIVPEFEFINLPDKNDEECIQFATDKISANNLDADVYLNRSIKLILIKQSEDHHLVMIRLPSIMADGYSLLKITENLSLGTNKLKVSDELIQYEQYSLWQNKLLNSQNEEAEYFWKNYDFSSYKSLKLPFEKNVDLPAFYSPECVDIALNKEKANAVVRLALQADVSPADILQGVLTCLISKHTASNHITVGKVLVDREYEELQETIGLISKTIPILSEVNENDSFIKYVKELKNVIQDVSGWEQYFLLNNERDQERNEPVILPLGFEYFDSPHLSDFNQALNVSLIDFKSFTDQFKLKLSCLSDKNGLQLEFCYDANYFDNKSVKVLCDQYKQMINTIIADPGIAIKDILSHSADEELSLLESFNSLISGDSPAPGIVELFELQAALTPDHAAITAENETYTYRELNELSNQLARHLQMQYEVKTGDVIGIMVERSNRMIVGLLGILKSGACFLPLDPGTPKDRKNFILSNARARLLLTDLDFMFELTEYYQGGVFALDLLLPDLTESKDNLSVKPDSTDSAYVIYTSGSTGRPKGVLVNHSSLTNYTAWFKDTFNISNADRTLLFSSISFDLCYTSLWSSLVSGSTLFLLKETNHIDPQELTKSLAEHKITYIKLTPSHFNILINTDFEELVMKYSLRLVVIGGEQIRVSDIEKFHQYRNDVEFVNHYGPTETTIGCIYKSLKNSDLSAYKSRIRIGRPINNTRVYILNERKERVALGITGEICVSGRGLSGGYINNDELTQSRFVANPYEPGQLLYHTGDLGRWTADGEIEFLGRNDDQVKIRGYRIELSEIESVLKQFAKVSKSAVIIREDKSGDSELVGYVESKEDIKINELQEYLMEKLPGYMVPAHLIVLNEFALTANGKIDRKALPGVEELQAGNNQNYEAPGNSLEEKLVEIWQEVLCRERIGIRDNFFQIGGHSLKAVQIIARIHKELQSKVELKDIFDTPTIAELSRIIKGGEKNVYETIKPLEKQPYYELSHAQKQLWFVDKFQDKQAAYNRTLTYLFDDLNIIAFEKAFETLIIRHEILRTSFLTVAGEPKQKVLEYEDLRFNVEQEDIRAAGNIEENANRIINRHASHIFDLTNGPLLKAILIQKDEHTHLFSLVLHHILCDGWSIEVLKKEIIALYHAYDQGQANPLVPLKVQYKDYAFWHNSLNLEKEENYWLNKLTGKLEMVNLPYDKTRSEHKQFKGEGITFELEKGIADTLKELSTTNNTTLSNTVLAVFLLFLNKITGQKDILLGIGHANRNDVDLESLIGLFVNTVVIRTRFDDDMSFRDLLHQVGQNCLEAYKHRNYSFDLLIEKLKITRDSSYLPLINVVYIYRNYEDLTSNLDSHINDQDDAISSSSASEIINHVSSKTDLMLYVSELPESLIIGIEYDSDLFFQGTAEKMVSILKSLFALSDSF
ncbi:hypothetical protein TH53_23825 [Pedobacter lusitanus]|uniref:Carrier domain-containing protein n=1 Tax=Pedobacter lusitanus TaxID=1503925 RepID=A0A0D0GC84_9SPHI|nr:non-ribosomal peptide synthetase [Pedobacter lusitanus]KIO74912.1 hypothetical protein TH53_23825 [Pedobacter lusitanus]